MLREVVQDMKNCICLIISDSKRIGSGFFINSKGIVATCRHILEDKSGKLYKSGLVHYLNRNTIRKSKYSVIKVNDAIDISLIKLDLNNPISCNVDETIKVEEGDSVATIGFPFASKGFNHPSVTSGIISAIIKKEEIVTYQLDMMVHEGNSGGPLFLQDNGHVIGIVSSRFDPFKDAQVRFKKRTNVEFIFQIGDTELSERTNIGYAIPISYIHNLI